MNQKSMTLRLSSEMYEDVVAEARRSGIPVNQWIRLSLVRSLEEARQHLLYNAFSQLGDDADVEFAVEAQSEVILG